MNWRSKDKIRQWQQKVKADDFDGVNEDIKDSIIDYTVEEHSAAITNLLSQVCQTSTKVGENNKNKALKIYQLSYTVCSKIKIINSEKYFSSLYWITQALFNNGLFDEAKSLCSFISPSSLFHEQSTDPTATYFKLSSTWQKALKKWLLSLSKNEIEMNFNTLISYISFQLNYLKLSNQNNSQWLCYYIKEYISIFIHKKISHQFIETAKQVLIINTLSTFNLCLGVEAKNKTFEAVISLVNIMLIRDIDDDRLAARSMIDKIFKIFDDCMSEDGNYKEPFKLFHDTCTTFIHPVNKITDQVDAEISGLTVSLKKANRYLEKSQSSDTKFAIQAVSNYLFNTIYGIINYWIRYLSTSKEFNLSSTTLINTAKFVIQLCKTLRLSSRRFECTCGDKGCFVKKDYHNSIKMIVKLINLGFNLYRRATLKIPDEFIDIIFLLSAEATELVGELKDENCKLWSTMWNVYLSSIYNLLTLLEDNYYEKAVDFYSLVSAKMIELKALDRDKSCFPYEDGSPLAVIFHRLTSVHYKHEKYDEAMATAAVNIYSHYKEENFKGFRMWINVKYKHKKAEEVSVIDRLTSDKSVTEEFIGLPIVLDNTKRIEINLHEIKALSDAQVNYSPLIMRILDSMNEIEGVDKINYIKGVYYLGSHVLNFATHKSITKYLKNAMELLKSQSSNSIENNLLKSNLKFYEFIEDLECIQNETEEEMKKLKMSHIKIYAVDSEKDIGKNDAGPTGSKIDIDTAIKFSKQLEIILTRWNDCFKNNQSYEFDKTNGCVTLKNIITAGEFCRFHRYQDLEIKFWKLAYLLATKYDDYRSIIYITGRCISARYIKEEWIKRGEDLIIKKFDTTNKKSTGDINAIAIFKLSLSEYYYRLELFNSADELFNDAMSLPGIEFTKSLGIYLYSLDIALIHRLHNFKSDETSHTNYLKILIEGIYTGASMWTGESAFNNRWSRSKLFYEIDCLLDFLCHASLRLSQLLTSNEILGNLIRRIPLVQKLANPLRTAELIKYLCFIDLSREKINDCEVKIQSIEHILKIEDIDIIQKLKLSSTTCQNYSQLNTPYQPGYIIEPLRDLPRNDASPVLRKKVFVMPEFSQHENNCKCFKCKNIFYKHLVVSSTHIRAQLHALQNENLNSLEHFTGGFIVAAQLVDYSTANKNHEYHHVIEHVYYLMDYAKLLDKISTNSDRAVKVVIKARDVCKKFHLEYHPISVVVNSWLLENKFEHYLPEEKDKSLFCVLDIDKQVFTMLEDDAAGNRESVVCLTPKRNIDSNMGPGRVIFKGKKINPMLTLSKVNAIPTSDDDDDDDDDLGGKEFIGNKIKARPIRRKFSESEFSDGEVEKEKEPIKRENKFFKSVTASSSSSGRRLNSFSNVVDDDDEIFDLNKPEIAKRSTKISRVTKSKNTELKSEKSSRQSKEETAAVKKLFSTSCDSSLKELIDEVRAVFDNNGQVHQLSSVERKLSQLQVRDGTTQPAKPRHIEVLLDILKDEKNKLQIIYLNKRLDSTCCDTTENKIEAIDCLFDKLTKFIREKNQRKNFKGEEGIFKDDSLDSVTKEIEKISLAKKSVAKKSSDDKKLSSGALKKKSQVVPENSTDVQSLTAEIEKISITKNKTSKVPVNLESSCELFSDDDVVEATIIEPRRSKRVAAKKK